MIDHTPPAFALPVPMIVVPLNKVTVALASADPVKVGAVTLVMLSVLEGPLSDALLRSGTLGVLARSMVMAEPTSTLACPRV